MGYPKDVIEAVRRQVLAHRNDIDGAVRAAIVAVHGLPGFEEYIGELVDQAVSSLVYQVRGQVNAGMKRELINGDEWPPADAPSPRRIAGDAVPATCESVQAAQASILMRFIDGREIGSLSYGQLLPLAEQCERRGYAALADGKLLRGLHAAFPKSAKPDTRVRSVVSADKANAIARDVYRRDSGAA